MPLLLDLRTNIISLRRVEILLLASDSKIGNNIYTTRAYEIPKGILIVRKERSIEEKLLVLAEREETIATTEISLLSTRILPFVSRSKLPSV